MLTHHGRFRRCKQRLEGDARQREIIGCCPSICQENPLISIEKHNRCTAFPSLLLWAILLCGLLWVNLWPRSHWDRTDAFPPMMSAASGYPPMVSATTNAERLFDLTLEHQNSACGPTSLDKRGALKFRLKPRIQLECAKFVLHPDSRRGWEHSTKWRAASRHSES